MNLLAGLGLIIGIAAGVVAVAIVVVIILLIVKSMKGKTAAEKATDDRELIAQNAKSVEALIVLANDDEAIISELKELQEKLKYLIPSQEQKVIDFDKKIKNLIGDLRIALTKSDGEMNTKATDVLKDIKIAIADRNAKV